MRTLVTAASKHGTTIEIAQATTDVLNDRGLSAEVREPDTVESLDDNDAFVVVGAIYMGRWQDEGDFRNWDEIRGWADENASALQNEAAPS